MTVYVVGSINGDVTLPVEELPAPGATVLAGEPVRSGGGKGANVAVAAARDGQRVRMVGAVGDDETGERSLAELRREGVDTGGVARLEETETGVAMICVDGEGENLIVVVPGANSGLAPELVDDALEDLAGGDVCVVSFEIPDEAVAAAARTSADRDAALIVNPSPPRPLGREVLAADPVVVVNAGELERLSGEDEIASGAAVLLEQGCATVVVTLGADGAHVAGAGVEEGSIPAYPAETTDTTGAGDAFTGLLAAALARGAGVLDAARRASAGAALSTERVGARTAMPVSAEIDRLIRVR
jgi:ribokinase